ncbi:unnamed protein product [Mytilus coruscus]|uniref:ZNFX1 domain-containing protein n=1 Tax=Mytilus coruscus TaxID=42192 RepID=A0A6J8EHJ1_MYTCO|nr:unnamed protein product [Mytilus coruscus]
MSYTSKDSRTNAIVKSASMDLTARAYGNQHDETYLALGEVEAKGSCDGIGVSGEAAVKAFGAAVKANAGINFKALTEKDKIIGYELKAMGTLVECKAGPIFLHLGAGVTNAAKIEDGTIDAKSPKNRSYFLVAKIWWVGFERLLKYGKLPKYVVIHIAGNDLEKTKVEKCVQENAKAENRQRDLEFVIPEIRDKWDPENTPNTDNKLSTLAILPDLTEIESCECCIVDSDYETEEGYLRRLFMVHRQDFISPLCRGFMSLKYSVYEDPDCLEKGWRHDDIRVYKNITFLTRCWNEQNGLTWKIRFDITPYSRINWNTRKLLIFGSLVCFTNRNFSFLTYATVVERNASDLKKGIFKIKFTETNADVNEILKQPDVLLIESRAFFPSYLWTLSSLKSMHSEVFSKKTALPFCKQLLLKRHIVEKDVF